MTDRTKALSDALRLQGVEVFRDESSYPLNRAQRNLAGKTHYVDDDTMKFHSSRILSCSVLDDGLLLGIVESAATYDGRRVYRPVFFDIFGTVVSRVDLDDSFKSADAARKEFWRLAESLDAVKFTIEALVTKRARLSRDIVQLDAVLATALPNEESA